MSINNNQKLREIASDIRMVVFDFDGVFTDNRVLVMQDGSEGVFCCRADGFGIAALRSLDIKVMVISTETNPVVGVRCQKLQIPCIQSCNTKAETLEQEAAKREIDLKNVAYMGNDINDIECLHIVGLPACVADAYPQVRAIALYITEAKGGCGAVREFCDYLVKAKQKIC